jgi:hypothetical protein
MNIKLSIEIANNIREDYFVNGLSRKDIAKKYSISKWTIGEIAQNRIWTISEDICNDYKTKLAAVKSAIKLLYPNHKICTKCHVDKDISNFNKANGNTSTTYSSRCKSCQSEYKKEYSKINSKKIKQKNVNDYQKNRDKLISKSKKYYQENKTHKNEYDKERYYGNLEKFREEGRQYYYDNKEACIERGRKNSAKKYKNDSIFKLRNRVSCEIKRALKKLGSSKNGHSVLEFLPYSMQELKEHIEKQFESWMTWDNWSTYRIDKWDDEDQSTWTWQLDHIIPQADLPYTSMATDNFQKCWALENLRPLSAKQNLLDGTSRKRHKNGRR